MDTKLFLPLHFSEVATENNLFTSPFIFTQVRVSLLITNDVYFRVGWITKKELNVRGILENGVYFQIQNLLVFSLL